MAQLRGQPPVAVERLLQRTKTQRVANKVFAKF
jgi:hypothetical protein